MEPLILYEDESVLAVNKPSGWIVNEADTTKDMPVLQTFIKDRFTFETANSLEFRSGIVHRLDKETSGVLLIAKTKEAFEFLQAQFKERKSQKVYMALLHDKLIPENGVISLDVGRLPWNRERFGVLPGGRESETKYEVDSYYQKDGKFFSLTRFYPKTGRTHQIRIHAKYLHHPIVSDTFYAGRKTARNDRKWCPRLFLHAYEITFTHPTTGKQVVVKSELPEDLGGVLNNLEKSPKTL